MPGPVLNRIKYEADKLSSAIGRPIVDAYVGKKEWDSLYQHVKLRYGVRLGVLQMSFYGFRFHKVNEVSHLSVGIPFKR